MERCVEIYATLLAQKPALVAEFYSLAVALTMTDTIKRRWWPAKTCSPPPKPPAILIWSAGQRFPTALCTATPSPEAASTSLRGARMPQDSGNGRDESVLAMGSPCARQLHGSVLPTPSASWALAIRNLCGSSCFSLVRVPLALLAAVLDRLGHYTGTRRQQSADTQSPNTFTRTGLAQHKTKCSSTSAVSSGTSQHK